MAAAFLYAKQINSISTEHANASTHTILSTMFVNNVLLALTTITKPLLAIKYVALTRYSTLINVIVSQDSI